MALEATHIRFALELKDELKVKSIKKYILGTSYPDSRYKTGIERDKTHDEAVFKKLKLINPDFKKGWKVHLLCDLVQYRSFRNKVTLLGTFGEGWPEDKWVHFTAAKMIQDMIDRQAFDIEKYLPCLDDAENPNKESLKKIHEFNDSLIELYSKEFDLIDYRNTLSDNGVELRLANKTLKKVKELLGDKKFMKQIKNVFPDMVSSYKKSLTI